MLPLSRKVDECKPLPVLGVQERLVRTGNIAVQLDRPPARFAIERNATRRDGEEKRVVSERKMQRKRQIYGWTDARKRETAQH
jgi:hypothetical protein